MKLGNRVFCVATFAALAWLGIAQSAAAQSPLPLLDGNIQGLSVQQQVKVSFVKNGFHPSPIDFWRGGIFFKVVVGGKTVWALLDNGADQTFIDTGLAKELGLRSSASHGTVRTSSGTMEQKVIHDVSIVVPQQLSFQGHMAGIDLSALSRTIGRKVEFVLGQEYLSNFAYFIDMTNMRLYFRSSGALTPTKATVEIHLLNGNIIDVSINGIPSRSWPQWRCHAFKKCVVAVHSIQCNQRALCIGGRNRSQNRVNHRKGN